MDYKSCLGFKSGDLEVIGVRGEKFVCRCHCGNVVTLWANNVLSQQQPKKSCGCWNVRPWTPELDKRLLELVEEGRSYDDIALILHMGKYRSYKRHAMLTGVELRTKKEADSRQMCYACQFYDEKDRITDHRTGDKKALCKKHDKRVLRTEWVCDEYKRRKVLPRFEEYV